MTARQAVLRLVELIAPPGTSTHTIPNPAGLNPGSTIFESVRDGTAFEPVYQEVEVSLPGRKSKGKKELVKVKKEAEHAFADWAEERSSVNLAKLACSQPPVEAQPCLRNIQVSPFNPPPAHLKQKGHQLYVQVATLEGETFTLICTSRGWYTSKSNVNTFDPSPRSNDGYTHSLVDLLHTLSPLFSERIGKLPPLSSTPPALEPISTVPIPQAQAAYPFLTTAPKTNTGDAIRSQLAYLHTGALSADAVDGARDWNEEIQGVKELPRESMQERVLREKMAQKTWAEFDAASVRCVLAVARGDVPPLNPNEDPRAHMFLISNIFITKAVDSIDAYTHLGGDAAAYISHAKDAAGVRLLNKLDIDGIHLLGHTVVDWAGERWVCQSMLPGIFSRHKEEEEDAAETTEEGEKKEDWVEVSNSPSKSTKSEIGESKEAKDSEEIIDNPLIIYGLDSERLTSIHWDAATHRVMSKLASAQRLAEHEVKDASGKPHKFYASAEVKGLRGTDGRRYLLDLPRLSPVDIEWLEKDIDGKIIGSQETGPAYPHRVVMLRPELVETFWETELKRWARELAAKKAEQNKAAEEKNESEENKPAEEKKEESKEEQTASEIQNSPAASAAAAQRAEQEAPIDSALDSASLADFKLALNPDAFVDQPLPQGEKGDAKFVPSTNNDESDPSIKAVRDASVFLRQVAVPAIVLDVLTGNLSGVMDGVSLSKHLHGRGINIRYLGYLASTIDSFASGTDGKKTEWGYLAAFKHIVLQEMVFRAVKHVFRPLLAGLAPEHAACAVSHLLNCLLGSSLNANPQAVFESLGLDGDSTQPEYTKLTPESLREAIVREIQTRFRFALPGDWFETELKKAQMLRELAMRLGFQLEQRAYAFDKETEAVANAQEDKENVAPTNGKDKKDKKKKTPVVAKRTTTFEPSDVLTLVPVVRSTASSVSVAEEIFEAGRATVNRGSLDLGLEFLLESVQLYENIHSVIHPEVAMAYNQYAATIHQLARLKIQQLAAENADPEQPLGLDVSTAIRLQRQAIIIAERTLGVYHSETCSFYFNLAMLENLEGDGQASLKYFRHVLTLWDVIYGPGHPEVNTVLSNAGVVLQALNEHPLSLSLLLSAQKSTEKLFGAEHLQTAQSLHQLTQAYFLAGDIPAALAASQRAQGIFEKRLGADHAQTKEVQRNAELLQAFIENMEKQKAADAQARERQLERLHAAQSRVGGGASRRRLGQTLASTQVPVPRTANGTAASASATASASASASVDTSKIGEKGHMDVDELVKFIQGGPVKNSPRGKNAMRGKRRTGAKQ